MIFLQVCDCEIEFEADHVLVTHRRRNRRVRCCARVCGHVTSWRCLLMQVSVRDAFGHSRTPPFMTSSWSAPWQLGIPGRKVPKPPVLCRLSFTPVYTSNSILRVC